MLERTSLSCWQAKMSYIKQYAWSDILAGEWQGLVAFLSSPVADSLSAWFVFGLQTMLFVIKKFRSCISMSCCTPFCC
ncbi:hypothetical protein Plhal304r1_c005g0020231 [Plasmopara halstedii]